MSELFELYCSESGASSVAAQSDIVRAPAASSGDKEPHRPRRHSQIGKSLLSFRCLVYVAGIGGAGFPPTPVAANDSTGLHLELD